MSLYPTGSTRPWRAIESAPLERDVEVRVADKFGTYTLTFPCRLTAAGWRNASTNSRLEVEPMQWREKASYTSRRDVA